jgi:hypothetical protein
MRYSPEQEKRMRSLKLVAYLTPEQIEETIREREAVVATMPPSEARQLLQIEIGKLRNYADAKRWLGKTPKTGADQHRPS